MKDTSPLSYDWLHANGFHLLHREERQPTDHVRRNVGMEKLKGLEPFQSIDDLCIELASQTTGDEWFCWVVQIEPRRHIHVRMMRERWEVVKLWEGLTGREWG
jgi:hypothetical protein